MSTNDSPPQAIGSEPELDNLDELILEAVGDGDAPAGVIDSRVTILTEYVEDIDPALMRLGWSLQNAKSAQSPYYKYDQSMLVHTRTGVFFLSRFIGEYISDDWLEGRGTRDEVLRELIAMFVVHDVHKLRDATQDTEFDIDKDEIEEFVEQSGVADFAPSLSLDDFHAVAVALHKSENSNTEMITDRFMELNSFLRLADGVASLSNPEDWINNRYQGDFENAIKHTATPHAHTVDGNGPLSSVINKATAQTFESYDYSLLTIHNEGCTYAANPDIDVETLPTDVDTFLTDLYQNFLQTLQQSFPRYRNQSILADAAESLDGHGYYEISDLDVLCLPPRDLLRAIVEQGITQADASWDLPKYAVRSLDEIHNETGINFDRTFRIEGVARIVHTLYESLIPDLLQTDASRSLWEREALPAVLAVFNVSEEMQSIIATIYEEHGNTFLAGTASWPYKYLIAHDIITRDDVFTGESGSETIEHLTDMLDTEFAGFDKWENYRTNRVGHIDEELRAVLFNRVNVDGEPLSNYGVPPAVEQFITTPTNTCGLCNGPTVTEQVAQPILIESPLRIEIRSGTYRHIEIEYDGDVVDLQDFCYNNNMCLSCQLDIELQASDTSWERDEDRLHVSLQPEYAYTPLSGIIFSNILDTYSSVGETRGEDFAQKVVIGGDSEESVYGDWLSTHTQSDFGREMLSKIERGFMMGSGYGGNSVSFPLPEGNTKEALFKGTFTACVATSYSGLSAYISTHPVISVPDNGRKELIELSPTLESIRPVFGDNILPLYKMNSLLKSTSAISRLGAANGHGHAPVHAYCAYKRNNEYPLVGSKMLTSAAEDGKDPEEYVAGAVNLDSHAANGYMMAHDIVRDARILGDAAYELLDRPDDAQVVRDFVRNAIDETVEHGRIMSADDLGAHLTEFTKAHDSVDLDAFETVTEFITDFAYLLAGEILNERHGASTKMLQAIRKPLCDGVWTHAVAINAGEHEAYQNDAYMSDT